MQISIAGVLMGNPKYRGIVDIALKSSTDEGACEAWREGGKDVQIRKDHNIRRLKQYVNVEYLWDKDNLLYEKDAPVDKGLNVFETLYRQRLRYR